MATIVTKENLNCKPTSNTMPPDNNVSAKKKTRKRINMPIAIQPQSWNAKQAYMLKATGVTNRTEKWKQ